MSLVCLAKAALEGGALEGYQPEGREEGGNGEGQKGQASPLVPNLIKVFNVIEVEEIDRRSGLLHFHWVYLSANKNFKSKLKAALREYW